MKKQTTFLMIFLLLFMSGCYSPTGCYGPLTGTVVDVETGVPIKDAVVYVEWTVTTGLPGLKSASTYKVVEKVTDKDGKFRVWGVFNPMVNRPVIVVYKKGYVAWRSDYIFPDYGHRKDFEWKRKYVFKLGNFKRRFSHSQHISFIRTAISLNSSLKLDRAFSWESRLARKEDELYNKKLKRFKPGESNKKIWAEVMSELYGNHSEDIK